jgi:hypothetical protein
MTPELSPEQVARSNAIWGELIERCRSGLLPFVKIDPANPQLIASLWDATPSDNEVEDTMRGVMYAELLLHRAKNWCGGGDPVRAIADICMAIARKGNPGAIESGFFVRLACCAMAGSLN